MLMRLVGRPSSSPVCSDMGARACSDVTGSCPCSSRYWRRPPPHSVRIRSLTVAPLLSRSFVNTAAGISTLSNSRRLEMRTLSAQRGAPVAALAFAGRARPSDLFVPRSRGRAWEINRATRSGSAARCRAARQVRVAAEGSGAGAGLAAGSGGPSPGSLLKMRSVSPAPLAPSIMAWCSLSMNAVAGRGSSRRRMPSTTRPCHSGRSAGSRSPRNSANSARASCTSASGPSCRPCRCASRSKSGSSAQ